MKRREFIRVAAAGVPLALLAPGCASALKRKPAATGSPFVRPDLTSDEGQKQLLLYAKAVAAMRGLDKNDGKNWTKQAEVHNTHCWHNSWYFFPWHRDYLMRFEAIIRNVLKNEPGGDSFVLPYWNWTEHAGIPDALMHSTGPLAPLAFAKTTTKIDPSRAPAKAATLTTQLAKVTNAGVMARIMAITDFPTFMGGGGADRNVDGTAGATEAGPHNGVHATIGEFHVAARSDLLASPL
jgi:tyrosinase